jgi:hypothetical protein
MPRLTKPAATRSKRKPIPYPFLQEALTPLNPEIKAMFSGYAVYLDSKLVCMLRDSPKQPEDNGLWLVLSESAHQELKSGTHPTLKKELKSLRKIQLLGEVIKHWLLIPADHPSFERESLHACELITQNDPRIGRIPKSRQ